MVDLLLGMGLGLFLCAAAAGLMLSQLREHKRLLAETLLQQDLRNAMALIRQEIRRSGALAAAHERVPEPGTAPAALDDAPSLQLLRDGTPAPAELSGNGLRLQYDRTPRAGHDAVDRRADRGFRLQEAQLQYLLERSWQPWSDSATVRFTRLELRLKAASSALARPCSCAAARRPCDLRLQGQVINVLLVGQSRLDASTVRSLHSSIRVRNDQVFMPDSPATPC